MRIELGIYKNRNGHEIKITNLNCRNGKVREVEFMEGSSNEKKYIPYRTLKLLFDWVEYDFRSDL